MTKICSESEMCTTGSEQLMSRSTKIIMPRLEQNILGLDDGSLKLRYFKIGLTHDFLQSLHYSGSTVFPEQVNSQNSFPLAYWSDGETGKTILASLVVEEARRLNPAPTVLFFYCKHDNSDRDNFVALGRSLLTQFLKQESGLLPTFYQKSCRSGEPVLTSPVLIEELLSLAFGNCKSAYIILDGLDECPRDQRKYITQWFRKLIENLPINEPEKLRCLFISQDDGIARKDFVGLASIKIRAEDSKHDIKEYSRIEADKLRENCPSVTKEKASAIASAVVNSAEGMLSSFAPFIFLAHITNNNTRTLPACKANMDQSIWSYIDR